MAVVAKKKTTKSRKRRTTLEKKLEDSLDLATEAAAFFRVRQKRLALARDLKVLEAEEAQAKAGLIARLAEARLSQIRCKEGLFSVDFDHTVFRVEDWPAFYAWVRKTGNLECLFRRVNDAQIREVLEHSPRLRKTGVPGGAFVKVAKATATEAK